MLDTHSKTGAAGIDTPPPVMRASRVRRDTLDRGATGSNSRSSAVAEYVARNYRGVKISMRGTPPAPWPSRLRQMTLARLIGIFLAYMLGPLAVLFLIAVISRACGGVE